MLAFAIITHIGLWAEIIGSSVPLFNALPIILLSVLVLGKIYVTHPHALTYVHMFVYIRPKI